MKKRYLVLLALAFMLTFCMGLFACLQEPDPSEAVPTSTVTFYENYPGGQITAVEVENGKTVEKPADPSRGGYTFTGWFTQYTGGEQFDFNQVISEDTSVFAQWQKTALTVIYKLNNGQADVYEYVSEGSPLNEPADPVRDQYDFNGWYLDADCTQAYTFGQAIDEDLTLYAGWVQNQATVVFNYNYTGAPESISQIVEIGKPVEQPSTVPERDMWAFTGWYTDSTCTTAYDFTAAVAGNMTLYAGWERSVYIVNFDPNYGDESPEEVRVSAGQAAQSPDFSRTGYDFDGWYTDRECKDPADLSAVNEDMTVYAGWKIQSYTVTFDLNYDGATGAPAAQTVEYGQKVAEPATPTRTGYTFFAWYTDKELSEQFDFESLVSEDTVLYARWIETGSETPDGVTLTFVYNLPGMGTYATVQLEYGDRPMRDMPDDPELEGYYFYGWYTDEACTKEFNERTAVEASATVYARLLKQYTFEAELTNLKGKAGQGSSVNVAEEGLIASGSLIGQNDTNPGHNFVSNGFYISKLYYNGAYIEFEITAEKATTNAVLELRLSSECKPIDTTLTDDQFQIIVNGTYDSLGQPTSGIIRYGEVTLPEPNLNEVEDADPHKTPFQNYVLWDELSLNAGANTIRLRNNDNQGYGGTYYARAPMIDCMYIYADTQLTMKTYSEWIEKVGGSVPATLAQAAMAAYVVSKCTYAAEV